MLHRSFKPAKCKTALKLAASRIKLMKNKRAVQVKQLRRELAQLLESGQVQTARIRVEHVVREEKTIAAYDLLEIYCELIAARLPMIESQKNCPIDLKEAIASVIFASPRCDDIPELKDVRKHLKAKYGKEFASAAVELRPNCGVGRLLVEKLSATAPDGPTKLKILCAIAEEHNVTWDPNKFSEGDSRPTEDLLNGPNTFGKASEMLGDLPSVPAAPPNHSDKRSNNVQVSSKSNERHDLPVNFHEQNARSSPHSQTDVGAHKTEQSGVFQPELRPTGSSAARTEFRHPYSGQEHQFSPGSQSWNMEFKDATAAAQAAAESAERASMAARAAAELSSRANGTRQYSTQSQRHEDSQRYAESTLRNEHHGKGPVNSAFHEGNSRVNFAQIDSDQQHDVAGNNENFHRENLKSYDRSSRSASLKSNATSVDGNPLGNNRQMADEYSRKNSSELEHTDLLGQVSFKKQSTESEVELVDRLQDGGDTKSVDAYGVRFAKQSSHASSHCQSNMFTDDHDVVSNINSQSLGDDANDNPFATNDDGFVQRKTTEMNPHENAAAVFDDSVSDDDVFNIDTKSVHKEHDYNLEFSSLSIKSPAHVFANANAWSDVQNANDSRGKSVSQSHLYTEYHSDPIFSESVTSSKVPSQSDDMFQATFDDSDGLSSENEEELDNTKHGRSTDASKYNSYSKNFEMTEDVSPRLGKAKEDTEILEESSLDRGTELNFGYLTGGLEKSGLGRSTDTNKHNVYSRASEMTEDASPRLPEAKEDAEPFKESTLDSGTELNFGLLTGGLRNKGNRHLPYKPSPTANASSSKMTAEDTFTKVEESPFASVKASISPGATDQESYNRKVSAEAEKKPSSRSYFDSRDDYFGEELTQHTSKSSQSPFFKKTEIEEDKKFRCRPQVKDFDSDDSDSEDDSPKQVLMRKAPLNNSFSRRTRAPPPNSGKSSYSKTTGLSESLGTPGYGKKKNSSSSSLYNTEIRREPQSQSKSSGALGSSEESRLAKQVAFEPNSPAKRSSFEESLKSSAKEEPSSSLQKIEKPDSTQSLKISNKPNSPAKRSSFEESLKSSAKEEPSYSLRKIEKPDSIQTLKISNKPNSPAKRSSFEESLKSSAKEEQSYSLRKIEKPDSTQSLKISNKPNSPAKRSSFEESLKSSAKEEPSNSLRKVEKPDSTQSLKTSSVESPSKERAAHVHPKLPDYDMIAARLQAIRQNRQ